MVEEREESRQKSVVVGESHEHWRLETGGGHRPKLHHTSRSQGRQDRLVAKRGRGHGQAWAWMGTISVCDLDSWPSKSHPPVHNHHSQTHLRSLATLAQRNSFTLSGSCSS